MGKQNHNIYKYINYNNLLNRPLLIYNYLAGQYSILVDFSLYFCQHIVMARAGDQNQQMSSSGCNDGESDLCSDIDEDKQTKLKPKLFRHYNVYSRCRIYSNHYNQKSDIDMIINIFTIPVFLLRKVAVIALLNIYLGFTQHLVLVML